MAKPIKIFINYRRADNPHFVELIRTHLAIRYGRDNVFMDFDNLPRFTQFADFIRQQIQQSDVVISMIGPRWLDLLDERAARPDIDYVRLEIEEALKHNKLIAPILILDADVPPKTRLPESMRPMLRSNIGRIRDGRELWNEIDSLVTDLEGELVRRGHAPFVSAEQSDTAKQIVNFGRGASGNDSSQIYQKMLASFNAGDWDAAVVWASKLTLDNNSLPPTVLDRVKRMEGQARAEIDRENDRRRIQESAAWLYSFAQAEFAANSPIPHIQELLVQVWQIIPDYDPDGIVEKLRDRRYAEMLARIREKPPETVPKPVPRPQALPPQQNRHAVPPRKDNLGWLWLPSTLFISGAGIVAVLLVVGVLLSGVLGGGDDGDDDETPPAAVATEIPTEELPPTVTQTPFTATTTVLPTHTPITVAVADDVALTNESWEPVIETFDGYQMAYVPAGCFMMGSDNGESDEQPVHEVCFDEGFWIDVYEVTNAQYGGPAGDEFCLSASSEDNQPRNCVGWYSAQAFCEARGGSLPSEAQWEYAARGPSGWVYPWGDAFVAENVVYADNSNDQTTAVGSRPGGVSWVGAYDMAGNVWEWTTTIYDNDFETNEFPYPYVASDGREDLARTDVRRAVRGGSFFYTLDILRGAIRLGYNPGRGNGTIGFRCARSERAGIEPITSTTVPPMDTPTTVAVADDVALTNESWEPIIETFDEYEMAYVPAGCFMMGSDDGASDEQPVHEVCFEEAFWIDVYEVTNAQYGSVRCSEWSSEDNQPRNCVDWYEAQAFCEGRGGSLPSEAQWEYAARGPSGWVYPWGDAFVGGNVVYADNSNAQTAAVGSRPGGVSWVGAYDMAGNLWEWTTTIYDNNEFPYPYVAGDGREDLTRTDVRRAVRGGSFYSSMNDLRGAYRGRLFPDLGFNSFGFRCVRS